MRRLVLAAVICGMAAPKQTDPQMKIRLPPELKERIERAADQNGRSQNAEIIARLEQSFDPARSGISVREANLFTLELMQALVKRFPTVTGEGLLSAMREQQSKSKLGKP